MDCSPMLAPWRKLSPLVSSLIKINQNIAYILSSAPPRAFHAYAIYLRLYEQGIAEAVLARTLADTDPYELVGRVLPQADGSLLAILSRLEPVAWKGETYRRLEVLLREEGATKAFLTSAPYISEAMIERITTFELVADPVALHVWDLLGFDERHADAVGSIISILRFSGVLEPDEEVVQILRRIRSPGLPSFLWRRLARIEVPELPGAARLPTGAKPIRSLRELKKKSRQYPKLFERIPSILVDFLSGRARFIEWHGKEEYILYVETALPGHLYLRDILGGTDCRIDEGVTSDLMRTFAASELRFSRHRMSVAFGAVLGLPFPDGEEWEDDDAF